MNTVSDNPLDTLRELPANDRGPWLSAHADETVRHQIGQHLQALCFSDIGEAQSTSAWLIDAADAFGDQPFLCRMLCLRAFVLSVANQFDDAIRSLDRARELAERLGDPKSRAGVAQTAVQPLVRLGRYREAIESAERAISLYEEAGDATAVARAHSNLGVVHRMLGHAEQALTHFDRALPGMEGDQGAIAQVQSNRAEALLDLVDFQQAEQAFRSALSSFQQAEMTRASAIVGGNLADLLGQQGRLSESMAFFERARTAFEEGGAEGDAARLESESAEVLSAVGLLSEAAQAASRSAQVLLAHGLRREAARALLVQGSVARRRLDLPLAMDSLTRAAAISAELGWRVGVGRANVEAARVALDQGDLGQAEQILEDALRDLSAATQDRANALLLQAEVLRLTDRLPGAARAAFQASEVAEKLGSLPIRTRVAYEQALQAEAEGDLESALSCLEDALGAAERQRGAMQSDRARSAWTGGNRQIYEDLCDISLRLRSARSVEIAFNSVERAKSRSLLELLQRGTIISDQHLASGDPDTIELLQRHRQTRGELNALYSWDRMESDTSQAERTRLTRERRADELERQLTHLEGRLSSLKQNGAVISEPISLDRAVSLTSDRSLIVEYFECRDSLGAFVITPQGVTAIRRVCDLGALAKAVEAARFQIDRGVGADHSGERGQRLLARAVRAFGLVYDLMVRPIQEALEGAERCVFVPAGCLHGFPFGALHDGESWLVERLTMTVAPSVSVLGAMTRTGSPVRGGIRVVGVGDAQAPEIEAEASAIATLHGAECELMLGSKATSDRVFADLRAGHTLHLACHGELGSDDPLSARVRLADRWITARELVTLDLNGACVILSCCDVGRGRLQSGDELFGMLRSILAGGASGVVAGFWPAHDATTKELMLRLHATLHADRRGDLGQALSDAQRGLMKTDPHPSRWATFSAIGAES
jgi:tetratricopeptide (TPR) repeat protein